MSEETRIMRKSFRTFSRQSSGQSFLEFALLVPLVVLLVVNVVNFGGLLYAYITVANASRSGASYMIQGPSSINAPSLPTSTQIQTLVRADLGSLPRGSTAPVSVCGIFGIGSPPVATSQWVTSYSPVTYTACTMPSNPPAGETFTDPQGVAAEIIGEGQVQYRYCPFISTWNFPGLGIYTSLPTCTTDANNNITGGGTTITRVAAMRILQ